MGAEHLVAAADVHVDPEVLAPAIAHIHQTLDVDLLQDDGAGSGELQTVGLQHFVVTHVPGPVERAWHQFSCGAAPGNNGHVLPLFGNDTARHLVIGFTPFYRKIGLFLNLKSTKQK